MTSLKRKLSSCIHIESQPLREFISEFLGTTFLMAMGIGSGATTKLSRGAYGNIVSQDIGSGLTVTFGIMLAGGVSGGHLNPSISLGLAFAGRLPWKKLPVYVLGQFLGAFVGSAIAFGIYYDALNNFDGGTRMISGANGTANMFATYPQDFLSTGSGFANEVFATSILLLCIMAIFDERNVALPMFLAPLFVGLTILLLNCSYCYNSGCAMNPARDLSPRLFTYFAGWGSGVFSYRNYNWFWVPIVGPILGGPLGTFVYNLSVGFHHSRRLEPSTEKSTAQLPSRVGSYEDVHQQNDIKYHVSDNALPLKY